MGSLPIGNRGDTNSFFFFEFGDFFPLFFSCDRPPPPVVGMNPVVLRNSLSSFFFLPSPPVFLCTNCDKVSVWSGCLQQVGGLSQQPLSSSFLYTAFSVGAVACGCGAGIKGGMGKEGGTGSGAPRRVRSR